MSDLKLHFGRKADYGQYRLIELPKELMQVIESDLDRQTFSIRGLEQDEAVLCTSEKTYSIRAVTLSNSICIVTPPDFHEDGDAFVRDSINQVIELTPSMPKLHRLRGILRGKEYDDSTNALEDGDELLSGISIEDAKSQLQASDQELSRGLKEQHILTFGKQLRPIAQPFLNTILELILNTVVSLSLPVKDVPASDIADTLASDHDVASDVSMQVMSWFGEISPWPVTNSNTDVSWTLDIEAIVKQLGLGVLSAHKETSVAEDEFLKKWRLTVGDTFDNIVRLDLLTGNYLKSQPPLSKVAHLRYFPIKELPTVPSDRFRDLFLTNPRWTAANLLPFLSDIARSSTERDKLLMKYTKATIDKDGTTWYAAKGGNTV